MARKKEATQLGNEPEVQPALEQAVQKIAEAQMQIGEVIGELGKGMQTLITEMDTQRARLDRVEKIAFGLTEVVSQLGSVLQELAGMKNRI